MKKNDLVERAYLAGETGVWLELLRTTIRNLRIYDPAEADKNTWRLERIETVLLLRRICEEHGGNDWSEDLSLADIIKKHLEPYLEEKNEWVC